MNDTDDLPDNIYGFGYLYERKLYYAERKGFDDYRAYDLSRIEDWPDGVEFYFQGEPPEDILPGSFYWMLVSDRVRKVMETNSIQGVQYLPVKVFHSDTGEDLGIYWAINLLIDVDSLDWEVVKGLDIFRFKRTHKYVSERLKRILENAGVNSGAYFYPMFRGPISKKKHALEQGWHCEDCQIFTAIEQKYELSSNKDWDYFTIPQKAAHLYQYHKWIKDSLRQIDDLADGNVEIFNSLFKKYVGDVVKKVPWIARSNIWWQQSGDDWWECWYSLVQSGLPYE